MKFYFLLQFRMLNRHMAEMGVNPLLGYPVVLAVFLGFSLLLFNKLDYAGYLYVLMGLSFVTVLGENRRNQFLQTCFNSIEYHKIRILENMIIILPFAFFLVCEMQIILAVILVLASAGFSFLRTGHRSGLTIPTPFGKKPFEFTVGFRSTYLVLLIAYFLVIMAISAGNFNLGIASLILVFLVCFTYYLNPENEYFVWIFKLPPGKFMAGKIYTSLIYSTILTIPVIISLCLFFPEDILIIAGFQALGYVYLSAVILAKYASFPNPISLPQFIILALTLWFPPLLVAVIPFFYLRSVNRLKGTL